MTRKSKGRAIESEPWTFPDDDDSVITKEFVGKGIVAFAIFVAVMVTLILIFN